MNTGLLILAALLGAVVLTGATTPTTFVGKLQSAVKKALGARSSVQLASVDALLKAFQEYGDGDLRKLRYILALAYHESGLKPIKEIKAKEGTPVWELYQKNYWPSGYYGRGFVQLTHDYNYKKMGDLLGIDLLSNPDLALEIDTAAKIAVLGMMQGIFTGKKLPDYFTATKEDSYNARRTVGAVMVNGKDTAALIQGYYNKLKQYV